MLNFAYTLQEAAQKVVGRQIASVDPSRTQEEQRIREIACAYAIVAL